MALPRLPHDSGPEPNLEYILRSDEIIDVEDTPFDGAPMVARDNATQSTTQAQKHILFQGLARPSELRQ